MPKVSFTNSKGLFQESGSGFLPLGGPDQVLGLGQLRTQSFVLSLIGIDGSGTSFSDNDVLASVGSLDVTVPSGFTATKIVVSKVIVNVTQAAGTTLVGHLDLSATSGTAVNAAVSSPTEVVGAGATYRNGQEIAVGVEADINLNSAACTVYEPNVSAGITLKNLYLVTTTTLSALLSAGAVNIVVEYYVV
jgi:hypothetical protein